MAQGFGKSLIARWRDRAPRVSNCLGSRLYTLTLRAAVERMRGHLAPQLLQAVELTRLRREDVHHHVEIVHQDPPAVRRALHTARARSVLALETLVYAVVDRLGLLGRQDVDFHQRRA